jgi:peptide-methionine (S)-S-oxide reductase
MSTERAVLAGGCFWGMQDLIRKLPGVVSTRVGYSGGEVPNATYRNHGTHAEAIEIIFDPTKMSFRDVLAFFFQIHDPTTRNRQGNDVGASYRSAIFYTSPEQKAVAEDTIADVNASGLWPGKVVTELSPVSDFWEAEREHQDYLEARTPGSAPYWRAARATGQPNHRRKTKGAVAPCCHPLPPMLFARRPVSWPLSIAIGPSHVASGGTTISHGGGLADRYAAALYDLADEQGALDQTVLEAENLGKLIDGSADFRRLLESPLIDIKQSIAAARAVLEMENFSPIIVRFVCVIAANRRLPKLRGIVSAFANLVAQKRGVITARVTTAHGLSDVQREALRARLIESGYGRVNIDSWIDPSLLGGLVVQIGSRLYDSSLKSRLQRLKFAMKGAA